MSDWTTFNVGTVKRVHKSWLLRILALLFGKNAEATGEFGETIIRLRGKYFRGVFYAVTAEKKIIRD